MPSNSSALCLSVSVSLSQTVSLSGVRRCLSVHISSMCLSLCLSLSVSLCLSLPLSVSACPCLSLPAAAAVRRPARAHLGVPEGLDVGGVDAALRVDLLLAHV